MTRIEIYSRRLVALTHKSRWSRALETKILLWDEASRKTSHDRIHFSDTELRDAQGAVLGVDRNADMLALSRGAAPVVAERIGYSNVRFVEGAIEALDASGPDGAPLIADASVDLVLSNCVLNLVNPSARVRLLANIRRVLRPGGRVAISDIVCDRPVPLALQQDPELWSGCISGAWEEQAFLDDFAALGFENVAYADRSEQPWKVVEGIEFRAVTLVGALPGGLETTASPAAAPSCC